MNHYLKLKGAGAAIKAMREKANKSQEEVAKLLGWRQEALSRCENNKLDLSSSDIVAFASKLGLPLGDVLVQCLQEVKKEAANHPNGILVKTLLNLMKP